MNAFLVDEFLNEPERYELHEQDAEWDWTRREFFRIVGGGVVVALLLGERVSAQPPVNSWGSAGGLGVLEAVKDAGGQLGEGGQFGRGDAVEDQVPNRLDVGRGGLLDGGAARLGEDDERAPGIGRALLAGDQAPSLHPGELVGYPALLPGQRGAGQRHAKPQVPDCQINSFGLGPAPFGPGSF